MRRMHRTGEGPRPREGRGPVPASRTAGREARPAATRATGSGRRRPSCGRNAPPLRLVSAGVLACSLQVAGCGGGDSGTGIPGVTPPDGTATYHEVTDSRRPGGYAFSGRLRDAVRIGIEDSPVDFTHPLFHGRVQLEGAAFAYWRPLAGQPTQQAFASCTAGRLCRVFRVDSRGDPARLQDLARTVLEYRRAAGRQRPLVPPRFARAAARAGTSFRRRKTSSTAPWSPWWRWATGSTPSRHPIR